MSLDPVMEGETWAGNKCNVTAVPETCQPKARTNFLDGGLPSSDLQSQQVLTESVDEAVHSFHTAIYRNTHEWPSRELHS